MRQSKVQQFCESVIEAGWLAALIVTPLFFNVYSSRVFEPDKITLVRTISLVMLLAFLVKIADGGRLWLPAGGGISAAQAGTSSDSETPAAGRRFGRLWRAPLLLPFALLVLSNALSTLFSVAPNISWAGSYFRLQGTYTFLSYVTIALLTVAHLRQPAQLRRLQHTIILTSLPISVYGVIQHFGRDPLQWGTDVTVRIAANAGNAIFLAAHLIMAFFLTLERVFSSFTFLLAGGRQPSNGDSSGHGQQAAPIYNLAATFAGSAYLFVLIVQLLAIFWTQSRGPWLGLFSGIYIFGLLLLSGVRPRNYRRWTAAWVGLGGAGVLLLVLLNTTSLGAPLRDVPIWGRLTTILESSGGTARVRVLLWEGASELITPQAPLAFPDGSEDVFNPLRPWIGYGPETMWLAFHRFYPPELAQWEARNASPDRSHNETWDSLVFNGIFGFLANSLFYLSIFFWALRWLGLVRSRRDAILSLALQIGGGLLLSAIFLMRGVSVGFLGVNWPTGLILGLVVYVTIAVFLQPESSVSTVERRRLLLLVACLSAVVAYYVEIHFGIAVAATRVYFWIITSALLVLGMRWLTPQPFAMEEDESGQAALRGERGATERRIRQPAQSAGRRQRRTAVGRNAWRFPPASVLPGLLIMLTLAYLYARNGEGSSNTIQILVSSLMKSANDVAAFSGSATLWLVLFTWSIGAALSASMAILHRSSSVAAQPAERSPSKRNREDGGRIKNQGLATFMEWARAFGLSGLVPLTGWLLYALVLAARLHPLGGNVSVTKMLDNLAGHFAQYTWVVVLWCLLGGIVFAWRSFGEPRLVWMSRTLPTVGASVILSIVAYLVISNVNIAQVQADVIFKQGQNAFQGNDLVSSAELYRRASVERPSEDYYLLFLGRSLIARASEAPNDGFTGLPAQITYGDALRLSAQEINRMGREDLMRYAEAVLKQAQKVNPLNRDLSANLGILHSQWSNMTGDPQIQIEELQRSLRHFDNALALSPTAAHLWNEKGAVLVKMGQLEEAEAVLLHSLSLDDRFEDTYAQLAKMYGNMEAYEKLTQILDQGLEKMPENLFLLSHKGVAQSLAGDMEGSLSTNLRIVGRDPNNLMSYSNLLVLYLDLDRPEEGLSWADRALDLIESGNADMEPDLTIYELIVDIYVENGRMSDAAQLLHTLIDLAPDEFRFPIKLAEVYNHLGDISEARRFGERAMELAPDTDRPAIQAFVDSLE